MAIVIEIIHLILYYKIQKFCVIENLEHFFFFCKALFLKIKLALILCYRDHALDFILQKIWLIENLEHYVFKELCLKIKLAMLQSRNRRFIFKRFFV